MGQSQGLGNVMAHLVKVVSVGYGPIHVEGIAPASEWFARRMSGFGSAHGIAVVFYDVNDRKSPQSCKIQ